jgi:hypothetical protein
MSAKAPPARRKFTSAWDEIDYLYHKLLYWLYDRGEPARALPFAERLERLLDDVSPDGQGIRAEECRSLICEGRGDFPEAIRHRENEIRLIKRLQAISRGTPGWDYVRHDYDYSDLSDRLDLLAMLYHDSGDLDRAIHTLRESKRLCEAHGIRFDGRDLLRDYLSEKKALAVARGKRAIG